MSVPHHIYRSDDAMLAGVCGGLADYFDVDSTLVRIIAVVFFVACLGVPLLLYVLLAVLIPRRARGGNHPIDVKASVSGEIPMRLCDSTPGSAWVSSNSESFDAVIPDEEGRRRVGRGLSAAITLGIMLICFGLLALLSLFVDHRFFKFWPAIIIFVGLLSLCTPSFDGWRISRAGYSIFLITSGVALQLWTLDVYPAVVFMYIFRLFWPSALVALGLLIIGGALRRDIFKLAAALLISLTLIIGIWTFGSLYGSGYIILPWLEQADFILPQSPLGIFS